MDEHQLQEAIRSEIQAEHTLISHRLGWYVGAMSLLMTAFAIGLSGGHTSSHFFGWWMPVLGCALSIMATFAVVPGVLVQWNVLQTQRNALGAARERLRRDTGNPDDLARLEAYAKMTSQERRWGDWMHVASMAPPVLIPVLFFLAWAVAWSQHSSSPAQSTIPGRFVFVPAGDPAGKARIMDSATGRLVTEGDAEFGKKLIP